MKSKSELMNAEEKRKKAESIIAGNLEEKKTSKTTTKPTTVILDEDTKTAFQTMVKKSGLNMGLLFNAFMKAYMKNSEIRKAVIAEISED